MVIAGIAARSPWFSGSLSIRRLIAAVFLAVAFPALAKADETNLALNAGFEAPPATDREALPDGWRFFTSASRKMAVTGAGARSGNQSLMVGAQRAAGAHMGLIRKVDVTAGAKYSFAAHFINNKATPLKGTVTCQLSIEWLDDAGTEIHRETSQPFDSSGSRLRWTPLAVNAKAPPKAVQANFVISELDGPGASSGSCFVDDVTILRADGAVALSNRAGRRGAGYLTPSSNPPRAVASTQARR